MADMRIVIGDPASKRTYQRVLQQQEAQKLHGLRIGEKFKGDAVGAAGYEFQITGGTDKDGFPMRRDVAGVGKRRLLLAGKPGFVPKKDGAREKKIVHAHTIDQTITQVNAKVVAAGAKPLNELMGGSKEEKGGETPEKGKSKA